MKIKNDNVIKLNKEDVPEILNVFCDSFYDYPVMRYLLKTDNAYDERLKILINFFVMARFFRNETLFGVKDQSALVAVASTSNPLKIMKIAQLMELRDITWQTLGDDAKKRYEKLSNVWAKLDIAIPNIHLNMLGVKHNIQNSGIGRQLIDQVYQLSLNDPDSRGVTLTTEDPAKVSFYEYMGYKITGHAKVDDRLETWNFFRADSV